MGYEIEKHEDFFEVRLSGRGSKSEIFKAVMELIRRDPKKEYPDLWLVAPEFAIPYMEYNRIVGALAYVFTKSLISKKTAYVTLGNDFQKAQLDLFQQEVTRSLPIDARVFQSRDDAIAWIKEPDTL